MFTQIFVTSFVPTLRYLVVKWKMADTISAAPQNACVPVQPLASMAPAIGLPMRRPKDMKIRHMPCQVPMTENDGHIMKQTTGGNGTKAPVKSLLCVSNERSLYI